MKSTIPSLPPLAVVDFATRMLSRVRKDRAEKLDAGRITLECHDKDVACAETLLKLAERDILDDAPLS